MKVEVTKMEVPLNKGICIFLRFGEFEFHQPVIQWLQHILRGYGYPYNSVMWINIKCIVKVVFRCHSNSSKYIKVGLKTLYNLPWACAGVKTGDLLTIFTRVETSLGGRIVLQLSPCLKS